MPSTTETQLLAGRYRLGPVLGHGGMSDVYRAVDERTGQPVALKVVRAADPDLAGRLAREVRVQRQMEHPGLIRLRDTGVFNGQAYLTMDLIEGTTLAVALRGTPLGPRRTAALGAQLADALAYVHGLGIVHRDVKPSNIMLADDGRALLADFGIARLVDSTVVTLDGTTLGTAAYMAPEQLEDHQVGPSADIWSLGMVLLECLTGQRVYEGTWSDIIGRRLRGPVPLPADLPVPWMLLLTGMMDHRPDHRLTATEVASLLASPVFARPWARSPVPDTEREITTVPYDLTALTSPHGGPAAPATWTATRTAVGAVPSPAARDDGEHDGASRRRHLALAAMLVAAALVATALAFALGSSPAVGHPKAHDAKVQHPTTTTAPPTPTTPTTPTASSAMSTLMSDIESGVDAGTIDPASAKELTNQAEQSMIDANAGRPDEAANDLQRATEAIQSGEQNGSIQGIEGATLQGALTNLATALGLGAGGTLRAADTTNGPGTLDPGNGHHGRGSGVGPGGSGG
jgi:eukaryotic-like serine/threonine-protein kinase